MLNLFGSKDVYFIFFVKVFVNNFERDQESGIENLFDSTQALPLGLFVRPFEDTSANESSNTNWIFILQPDNRFSHR